MNNIIAFNGTTNGFRRGRGICDFSSADVSINYNMFFDNEISALLKNGRDYRRIRNAEPSDNVISDNADRNPRFRRVRRGSLLARSRARNRGNIDPQFNDRDGTRNDIGFTGGPESLIK